MSEAPAPAPALGGTEASGEARLRPGAPQPTPPATIVIFGATGDLAMRKLLPALYHLAGRRALGDGVRVVGVGRRPMTDEAYRDKVKGDIASFGGAGLDAGVWEWMSSRVRFAHATLADEASYDALERRLVEIEGDAAGRVGRLYYLATPPSAMADIVGRLGARNMLHEGEGAWRRVVFEKPFGYDLASARELNRLLRQQLDERQIYRIDHYLGKETVQNLMAFRFGNGIFEPIWNRRYIDHVQITVAETVGVEERGSYYDEAGALRDMIQNHLFQLLALTAMEPPISFEADAVRDERVKVLHAIHLWCDDEVRRRVVRGQYVASAAGNGPAAAAYRSEPEVAASSTTETFVALKLFVENWRWAEVPFYLRSGKRLAQRVSEIAVQFKCPPFRLFQDTPVTALEPNVLLIRIQPDEGISLRFQAKVPGPDVTLGAVEMDFDYSDYFASAPATGYETLLYDGLTGDQTLFHRADMVDAGWQVVEPILELLRAEPGAFLHEYPAFTSGPAAADALLARDGRAWRPLDRREAR
jgi:glucose-6-phosphate 1-dehydrogenase